MQLHNQIYQDNKAKGFWDKPRTLRKCLMLVITELSEAVEAYRKGKWVKGITKAHKKALTELEGNPELKTTYFKEFIKDTVEDELADAAIRIFDYSGGFNLQLNFKPENYGDCEPILSFESDDEQFLDKALEIIEAAMKYYKSKPDFVLDRIFTVADFYGIDLMFHIQAKLEYNRTRPYKHGKSC